jgi:nitric oxide reductase subunit B
MSRSKNLGVKYLAAAVLLFGVMTVAGLMSAVYYINPDFLFGLMHFSVAKMLHIDTMIIWLLMGFMGAVYWFLPEEFECEPAGIWAAEILFWVFVAAVLVVAGIFVFVQWGPGTETTLWLFQQGRKYVEAPRWAAIGVALVMLVFAWNVVGTALKARRITGVMAVMSVNMVPLVLLYLIAFPKIDNMAVDLYWWWWLVHLWVEATWEILIGPRHDEVAGHVAQDRRRLALRGGVPGPRHRHPRPWAPLFLDRHA